MCFDAFQTLRKQYHICFIDWCKGERREGIAIVVGYGDGLLPLLVFVAGVANPIAPFLATVLVLSPRRMLRSRCFSSARWATEYRKYKTTFPVTLPLAPSSTRLSPAPPDAARAAGRVPAAARRPQDG